MDEWFTPEDINGDAAVSPDIYLTANVFVPLISKSYLAGPYRNRDFQSALARELMEEPSRVLPVRVDDSSFLGASGSGAAVDYRTEGAPGLADRISECVDRQPAQPRPTTDVELPENEDFHALPAFVPRPPRKGLTITRYGIVHLMKEQARTPASEFRVRVAVEVWKHLSVEHRFGLGWPYDIWRRGDSIFLSALPNFSSPHQTLEFVLDNDDSVARLKSIWTAEDVRYGRIDFHDWQPSVAMLTADHVVPCLEREVAIRLLEQADTEFGFPLTCGEAVPNKLCGWIENLPPYDFMEWGRDPRLIAGRIGSADYVLHDRSKIAAYTFLLVGRWSADSFRTLKEAMAINLPNRYQIGVAGQGRVRVTVFLADTTRKDTGRANLAVRRTFAAVARMYAVLRQLPVAPADGSAALPPIDSEMKAQFDQVCTDLGNSDEVAVAEVSESGFDAAPIKKLNQTAAGRSLGFSHEPAIDLDSLVTHRDIVQFVQWHE